MLEVSKLTYQYDSDIIVFPDISCNQGDQTLLLGGSGTGKTTFLQLLSGLRTIQSGDIIIGDSNLRTMSQSARDSFRGKHIGLVFQTSHFVRALSVKENLLLAQSLSGLPKDIDKIKELLERLNISAKIDKKTYELSQGEQQRVAIARALVNKPILILADEPTSALDDHNAEGVVNLLVDQATKEDATLIIVTHDNRLKDRFTNKIEL